MKTESAPSLRQAPRAPRDPGQVLQPRRGKSAQHPSTPPPSQGTLLWRGQRTPNATHAVLLPRHGPTAAQFQEALAAWLGAASQEVLAQVFGPAPAGQDPKTAHAQLLLPQITPEALARSQRDPVKLGAACLFHGHIFINQFFAKARHTARMALEPKDWTRINNGVTFDAQPFLAWHGTQGLVLKQAGASTVLARALNGENLVRITDANESLVLVAARDLLKHSLPQNQILQMAGLLDTVLHKWGLGQDSKNTLAAWITQLQSGAQLTSQDRKDLANFLVDLLHAPYGANVFCMPKHSVPPLEGLHRWAVEFELDLRHAPKEVQAGTHLGVEWPYVEVCFLSHAARLYAARHLKGIVHAPPGEPTGS